MDHNLRLAFGTSKPDGVPDQINDLLVALRAQDTDRQQKARQYGT